MKKNRHHLLATAAGLLLCMMLLIPAAQAKQTLRLSCSAQINDTLGQKALDAFTAQSGITVELYVSTSEAAVYRLMNGFSELAASVRPLYYRHRENGYVQTAFCRDPIAVIANRSCKVTDLTQSELRAIFSKAVTNWKEVGGADKPITVIVPGKGTAAYKNFDSLAMRHSEILYDFMSYRSTRVIEAVQQLPDAVSFIARGATSGHNGLTLLDIDGISPENSPYPYVQTFYFITRGEPSGAASKFIDFMQSKQGIALMKAKGVIPVKP